MAQDEAPLDHGDKMCALTCCTCHLDLEKLKPLVRNAEFICKDCAPSRFLVYFLLVWVAGTRWAEAMPCWLEGKWKSSA